MLTLTELRDRLLTADVEAIADAANVSTKTIYRIRWDAGYNATLKTINAIEVALSGGRVPREPASEKAGAA